MLAKATLNLKPAKFLKLFYSVQYEQNKNECQEWSKSTYQKKKEKTKNLKMIISGHLSWRLIVTIYKIKK